MAVPEQIFVRADVLQHLYYTTGKRPVENGGLLGSNDNLTLTHFYDDHLAEQTRTTYSPDVRTLNVVAGDWHRSGIEVLGAAHSHPDDMGDLTPGDRDYASRLLQSLNRSWMVVIIVLPEITPYSCRAYVVSNDHPGELAAVHTVKLIAVDETGLHIEVDATGRPATPPAVRRCQVHVPETPMQDRREPHDMSRVFSRVEHAYDASALAQSRVILVGVGGGALFAESLVRCGVEELCLVDPDVVSLTNLATQHVYNLQDAVEGRFKVDCLARSLAAINPNVRVSVAREPLESLGERGIRKLAFEPMTWLGVPGRAPETRYQIEPRTTLLAALTDSHPPQAMLSSIALRLGLPFLAGQVYREGRGIEVIMTHPDLPSPAACHGCILAERAEAAASGTAEVVTSHGAPLLATERLHALKVLAAMVLLHYDTDHPYWRPLAERIGNRNLMVARTWDPDISTSLGVTLFEEAGDANGRRICDDTVFVACDARTGCPQCGGSGNLAEAIV